MSQPLDLPLDQPPPNTTPEPNFSATTVVPCGAETSALAEGAGRVSGRLLRTRSKKLGFAPIAPPEPSGGNGGPSIIRRPSGRTT